VDVDSQPHLFEIVAALKEITARVTMAVALPDAAHDLVAVTTNILPADMQCAVTLIHQGGPATFAATGLTAELLDEVRYSGGDGPCMQAIRTRDIVISQDLTAEDRWPSWCRRALAHGVRSVLSYPFDVDDPMLAALNLYAGDCGALAGEIPIMAMLMADHAGLLLRARLRQGNPDESRSSGGTSPRTDASINRAMGIIMAQRGCPPDQALRQLHDAAASLGVGLAFVAERLVRTVEDRGAAAGV
jgi:GAF domain-containing protein/ANTAR domain-containing protein